MANKNQSYPKILKSFPIPKSVLATIKKWPQLKKQQNAHTNAFFV